MQDEIKKELIRVLTKLFIARRGYSKTNSSSNTKTLLAASNWIKKINKLESLLHYPNAKSIKWNFNMSLAPWSGDHFQKMIIALEKLLHKTVGNSNLK